VLADSLYRAVRSDPVILIQFEFRLERIKNRPYQLRHEGNLKKNAFRKTFTGTVRRGEVWSGVVCGVWCVVWCGVVW
jgi:hypothetical protein